jgi:hypothetical protein
MHSGQVRKTWRRTLVSKLQTRYGMAKKEAQQKADAWLRWVTQGAQLFTKFDASTELPRQRRSERPPSLRIPPQMMTMRRNVHGNSRSLHTPRAC